MTSENESMFEFNDVVMRILVVQENSLQDFNLNFGLSIEFGVILDDLECNIFFLFVVKGLENLPKRSLTQGTEYFIPVRNGVSNRYLDVTLMISKILNRRNSSQSGVVHFVLLYFLEFKFGHVRESALLICGRSVLVKVYVGVSDLCLDVAEFVLL